MRQSKITTIKFDTAAAGGIDGVDFDLSPSAKSVTFDFKIDGAKAAPDAVLIGPKKTPATSVPFTIEDVPKTGK